jgi:AcrR family transcriptional regulator
MTTNDPIQEQLIRARRNQILDAATKVFAEKGFSRATIKDVARTAGIADGTIYNYFENKTALMLGILDRLNQTEQRDQDFAEAESINIQEWGERYIKQRFEALSPEGFQIFQVLIAEVLVNKELRELYYQQVIGPTFALAEKYFQQWAERGLIKTDDPILAPRIISGMFLGLIVTRLMGDPVLEERWDEVPNMMTNFIMKGLEQDSE